MAKLFRCNTELTEVAEWCIAESKEEAYSFMDEFWDCGEIMQSEYVDVYLENNEGKTLQDFIDYFFIEENDEDDFTHPELDENGKPITKKVKEWIEYARSTPIYFCHGAW